MSSGISPSKSALSEETITVRASASEPSEPKPRRVVSRKAWRAARRHRPCEATTVGGNIKPPRKLVDVRPDFPENLRAAGASGVVTLNAVIGVDGKIRELDVVERAASWLCLRS